MSIDYTTYVGPYIKVHNPPKDAEEEFHACPNSKCRKHKDPTSDGFCSVCGRKIKRMKRPVKKPIQFEYWDEFDGRFSEPFDDYKPDGCDEYMFLIPNMDNDVGKHLDGRSSNELTVDASTLKELNKFKREKLKEITRLKEVFGVFAVEVKWGVLTYLS